MARTYDKDVMGVDIGGNSIRVVVSVVWRPGNRMVIRYDDGTDNAAVAAFEVAEAIAAQADLVLERFDTNGVVNWVAPA